MDIRSHDNQEILLCSSPTQMTELVLLQLDVLKKQSQVLVFIDSVVTMF